VAAKCGRCGATFREDADAPHAVLCWACGARRKHPKAAARPVAFRLEAFHHYATRREQLLRHRMVVDGLVFVGVLAAALGGASYLLRG
jgi:hypothetical protein